MRGADSRRARGDGEQKGEELSCGSTWPVRQPRASPGFGWHPPPEDRLRAQAAHEALPCPPSCVKGCQGSGESQLSSIIRTMEGRKYRREIDTGSPATEEA